MKQIGFPVESTTHKSKRLFSMEYLDKTRGACLKQGKIDLDPVLDV